MREVVIVSAVRSPLGSVPGAFSSLRPDDLLSEVMREAIGRLPQVDWHEFGDVLVGCASPEAEQGLNIARQAAVLAGLPVSVPAAVVSRFQLSAFSALMMGAAAIRQGITDLMLVGGVEAPSRVPFGGYNPSPSPRVLETHPDLYASPWLVAENTARTLGISRDELDTYALRSRRHARQAAEQGAFRHETASIPVRDEDGRERLIGSDERRDDHPAEPLSALPAHVLADGAITLGNSAAHADSASALVLMDRDRAIAVGQTPLARLVDFKMTAASPDVTGQAAWLAVRALLERTGIGLERLNHVECDEPTAVDALAFLREFPALRETAFNPYGGALALGHAGGATGTRLAVTLTHALRQHGGHLGLIVQGGMGGMGAALLLERM